MVWRSLSLNQALFVPGAMAMPASAFMLRVWYSPKVTPRTGEGGYFSNEAVRSA
jgi:hypothetical protein